MQWNDQQSLIVRNFWGALYTIQLSFCSYEVCLLQTERHLTNMKYGPIVSLLFTVLYEEQSGMKLLKWLLLEDRKKQTVLSSKRGKVMNCPSVIGYRCIKSNRLFIIRWLITTLTKNFSFPSDVNIRVAALRNLLMPIDTKNFVCIKQLSKKKLR